MDRFRLPRFIIPFFLIVSITILFSQDRSRDIWQQPEKIMDTLGIEPGMNLGEAGAGDGYFTFKLSGRVGATGHIFANDIVKSKLDEIDERCLTDSISNITTVLGELEDPLFPRNDLDMIMMVYVFHHLDKPLKFLRNCKKYLKPGAPLIIIERDPEKFGQNYDHFLKKEKLIRFVKLAGFEIDRLDTFLPRDNIFILKF